MAYVHQSLEFNVHQRGISLSWNIHAMKLNPRLFIMLLGLTAGLSCHAGIHAFSDFTRPPKGAISDDRLDESNAMLIVAFANPCNAKLGTGAHTLAITAAALVTPCSDAGKKATMTMPHFTKGDKSPNSRHMNF